MESAAAAGIEPAECIDPGTRLAALRPTACRWHAGCPLRWSRFGCEVCSRVGRPRRHLQAVTDLAVEHAKNRVQFGRPIGVNQAIKHACVDMAVASEAALQQTLFGAISLRSAALTPSSR